MITGTRRKASTDRTNSWPAASRRGSMQSKPDVWFATAEQIATYVKQQAGKSD